MDVFRSNSDKNEENKLSAERYLNEILQRDAKPYKGVSIGRNIRTEIEDQEEREKKIKNDALEQDLGLKKNTLKILFWFLAIETAAVFLIAFLQGFKPCGFYLEEWSFRVLLVSTILQITAMLTIAVQHLFPKRS